MRVTPEITDLSREIEQVLTRQATRDAKHIRVNVDGTTVNLSA